MNKEEVLNVVLEEAILNRRFARLYTKMKEHPVTLNRYVRMNFQNSKELYDYVLTHRV